MNHRNKGPAPQLNHLNVNPIQNPHQSIYSGQYVLVPHSYYEIDHQGPSDIVICSQHTGKMKMSGIKTIPEYIKQNFMRNANWSATVKNFKKLLYSQNKNSMLFLK